MFVDADVSFGVCIHVYVCVYTYVYANVGVGWI